MICPEDGGKIKVIDTVHIPDTNEIYRRRRCLVCGHTFHTIEFEVDFDENVERFWKQNNRYKWYSKHKKRRRKEPR